MTFSGLKWVASVLFRRSPVVLVSRSHLRELENRARNLAVLSKAYDELNMSNLKPLANEEQSPKWFQ